MTPNPIVFSKVRMFRILLLAVLAIILSACNTGPAHTIGVGEEQLLQVDTAGIKSHTIFLATMRTRSS